MFKKAIVTSLLFSSMAAAGSPDKLFDCLDAVCAKPQQSSDKDLRLETCYFDRANKLLIHPYGSHQEFYVSNSQATYYFETKKAENDSNVLEITLPNKQVFKVGRKGVQSGQFADFYLGDPSVNSSPISTKITLSEKNNHQQYNIDHEAETVAISQLDALFKNFMTRIDFEMGDKVARKSRFTTADYQKVKQIFSDKTRACQAAASENPTIKDAIARFQTKIKAFNFTPSAGSGTSGPTGGN